MEKLSFKVIMTLTVSITPFHKIPCSIFLLIGIFTNMKRLLWVGFQTTLIIKNKLIF